MTDDTQKPAQPGAFQQAVEAMTPDQLEIAAAIVTTKQAQLADPFKDIGSMSNTEARNLILKKCGFAPGF